eukprot:jgi/Orpsp1_1/1177365/evm.model.c7180000061165.1
MLFKNILKFTSFLILTSTSFGYSYTGKCNEIEILLRDNYDSNLTNGDTSSNPLFECESNSKGEITEIGFFSSRNDKKVIEKALNQKSLVKLEYEIEHGADENDKAIYNEFPSVIAKLPNLEELKLSYYIHYSSNNDYPKECSINTDVLNISSKKLKTLTLEDIIITDDVISKVSKISSLKEFNIITTNKSIKNYYDKLRNLKDITVTINNNILSNYSGECAEIEDYLMENVKKNLYEEENEIDFKPLKECKTNEKGEVVEMYLDVERNDEKALTSVLSHNTITKLTYLVNEGFYQHEGAVYGEFPSAIRKLPNLEDLTLKYYYEIFYKGDYPCVEGSFKKDILKISSKKLKT